MFVANMVPKAKILDVGATNLTHIMKLKTTKPDAQKELKNARHANSKNKYKTNTKKQATKIVNLA